uniref:Uncharacterized protein n=1 Tax=Anguilla anguilla TaxID=7936 RepID=A0A0E9WZ72_ANGAN
MVVALLWKKYPAICRYVNPVTAQTVQCSPGTFLSRLPRACNITRASGSLIGPLDTTFFIWEHK